MAQQQTTPLSLGTDNLGKLLGRYAIPAIVATVTSALYNITDSVFIGKGVGPLAMTALGVCMPIMSITAAFGAMIGVGGSALASIRLGQGNKSAAFNILGNIVLLNLIFGIGTMAVCLLFLDKLLFLFGASEATIGGAHEYMKIMLWGNVVTHLYLGLNAILRSTGYPTKSMIVMLISVAVNCVLDPLFIFVFKWGIAGSAYATVIAQTTALIYELVHFSNPKNFLYFRRSIFRLSKDITMKIISIGMAPFLVQSCASLVAMLNNNALKEYGGDLHIGAFSIVNRIALLFIMFVNGLNQGMQPIVGYNYGAKLYSRVLKILRMGLGCGIAITTTGFLCAEFMPRIIAGFFADSSTPMGRELIELGAHALRVVMMAMPVVGFQIVAANFFQSIGKPQRAIALSITRQVLFLVPLLLFMPRIFGIEGVWYCMPIADVASAILAGILLTVQVRKLRQNPDSERSI